MFLNYSRSFSKNHAKKEKHTQKRIRSTSHILYRNSSLSQIPYWVPWPAIVKNPSKSDMYCILWLFSIAMEAMAHFQMIFPAINLHIYSGFSHENRHVIVKCQWLCQSSPDGIRTRCWKLWRLGITWNPCCTSLQRCMAPCPPGTWNVRCVCGRHDGRDGRGMVEVKWLFSGISISLVFIKPVCAFCNTRL